MKKVLLGTTALLGAGLVASPAFAADGIKLSTGGFYRAAYQVVFDDDSEGEPGNETNTDNLFQDAEIHFDGETTLDNGLTVGVHVELEGETDGDQIDEAYGYFSGGFGELRFGSDDEALAAACILPPGGTTNFSAFSPNQWAANTTTFSPIAASSNSACTGVDDSGDAQKFVYISPSFSGFQLTLSYTPDGDFQTHTDGAGPHIGMSGHAQGTSRHNFSAYASYTYEADEWGLYFGGGGSWEGKVEETGPGDDRPNQDFYQTGLSVYFGGFSIGGTFEYYNDFSDVAEGWVAGGGAAYNVDAWTVGVQYSHLDFEADDDDEDAVGVGDTTRDRVVLTGNYAMGPGVDIDAELGYTWTDSDPEGANFDDDYDGFELGIGTVLSF